MDKQSASNFDAILENYAYLIQEYDNCAIEEPRIRLKRKRSSMEVHYPLKEHPIYGITVLYAYEKYDEEGYIVRYMYNWYTMYPKSGKHQKHISSWENGPHDDPHTPDEFRVSSEPHHQHHTPGNRNNRQPSFHVRCLEDVFFEIEHCVIHGSEYLPYPFLTQGMIESMFDSSTNIINNLTEVSEIMFNMVSRSGLPPEEIKSFVDLSIEIYLNYPEGHAFQILASDTNNLLIFDGSQFRLIERRK